MTRAIMPTESRAEEQVEQASARADRALTLLASVLRLVDRRGHSWPDAQATVREAESFLADNGIITRQEPVVLDRLAYRDGKP